MVTSPAVTDPLMVTIKAVDPAQYPYYGSLVTDPAAKLTDAVAFVAPDVLDRLRTRVGESIVGFVVAFFVPYFVFAAVEGLFVHSLNRGTGPTA